MKHLYRIQEDGDTYWTGRAYNPEHALELAYDDGGPGSCIALTVQRHASKKLPGGCRVPYWKTVWTGAMSLDGEIY